MRHGTKQRPGGFTLIELLVVMIIIGILAAFVLISAMDGVRRAEERATQSLIIKLDSGMTDRIEALLATSADVLPAHVAMAAIPNPNYPTTLPQFFFSSERAQVIARIDQMKFELPDTFYVQFDPNNIQNA